MTLNFCRSSLEESGIFGKFFQRLYELRFRVEQSFKPCTKELLARFRTTVIFCCRLDTRAATRVHKDEVYVANNVPVFVARSSPRKLYLRAKRSRTDTPRSRTNHRIALVPCSSDSANSKTNTRQRVRAWLAGICVDHWRCVEGGFQSKSL
jgi:hypothetical protein